MKIRAPWRFRVFPNPVRDVCKDTPKRPPWARHFAWWKRKGVAAAWLAMVGALVAGIDLFTGPFIQFPFFFLLPVALASWHTGRTFGMILALGLPLIRPLYFAEAWGTAFGPTVVAANAVIKMLVFAVFAELIHRIAEAGRFRTAVLECLPVGIWVADRKGRIVKTNPAGSDIWGEDALGRDAWSLGVRMRPRGRNDPGEEDEGSLVRALEMGEATAERLLDVDRQDGGRRIVLDSATPILDEQGRIAGSLLVHQDITEAKRLEEEREELVRSLEQAQKDIKILRGLLPVCAGCKRIRDDRGEWLKMEKYIKTHSEADVSHGICPECFVRLYPGFEASA